LWLPPLAYMALIFYLSAQPNPLPALTERVWDKAIHTIEYAVLGLLLCRALIGEGLPWAGAAVLAVVLTSAYGSSDEWHQMFTPGRSSDLRDWTADSIGGAVGAAAYAVALRNANASATRSGRS
jgi:VanZ family protein